MTKTNPHIEQLKKKLSSNNTDVVLMAISEIRKNGNPGIIEDIIHLFCSTNSKQVKDAAIALINDLKDAASIPVLVNGIEKQRGNAELHFLVSACWQCGQDFSNYISVFVDIFLEEDYLTAFEAFTVIENSLENLSQKKIDGITASVKSKITSASEDKKVLFSELVRTLSAFIH